MLSRLKVLGPYQTAGTSSITIEFPSLPQSRSAFLLWGNGNGTPVLAIALYDVISNTVYITYILPTQEDAIPLDINGNQIIVNNLRTWGYFYVLCPWL